MVVAPFVESFAKVSGFWVFEIRFVFHAHALGFGITL